MGTVPFEINIVRCEYQRASAVEDGDMEFLHIALADNAEDVVGGLVRGEDIGAEESEGVDDDSPCGVDKASELVEAAQGDSVAVGGVNVEVMGHILACRHGAVAE